VTGEDDNNNNNKQKYINLRNLDLNTGQMEKKETVRSQILPLINGPLIG